MKLKMLTEDKQEKESRAVKRNSKFYITGVY